MFVLKFLIIVEIIKSVTCVNCSVTSWEPSFNSKGQSKCQESNYYIRGLERSDVNLKDDPLDNLDAVECCSAPPQWSNIDILVEYTDWDKELTKDNSWANCPNGYFLQGLYRSNFVPITKGYLDNINSARCAKPATHPINFGGCYVENITDCFNKKGRCSCRDGYYINGLFRSKGKYLYNLNGLNCCPMAEKPVEINSVVLFKNRIMDITLWRMANLANMLGYAYCSGNRGVNVGEDFEKNGDTWEASKKIFKNGGSCEGKQCNQRLNLAFGDWSFAVKDIQYGQSVSDDLQTETVHTGSFINNGSSPATQSFTAAITALKTITHTTTTNWTNSHELGFSLNFNVPTGGGASLAYTTKFETSTSNTNATTQQDSQTFQVVISTKVPPNSVAKYSVTLSKKRKTVPYTAIIIVKFSTEFRGFLRWGQGLGSPTTNFHVKYKGSDARPTLNYRFGSQSVPFYTALKTESETQQEPWIWNDILKNLNYPLARQIINSLINEAQYEFTLSGTLEQVAGTDTQVIWEKPVKLTQREVQDRDTTKVPDIIKTVKVSPGPNDRPAKVQYPTVSLVNPEQVKYTAIPMNTDSV